MVDVGCGFEEEECSLQRCQLWLCGEERPRCPCNDLCERPACSDASVTARDPFDDICLNFESLCDVPTGWEVFWRAEACELGLVACQAHGDCDDDQICDLQSCAGDDFGVCRSRPLSCSSATGPEVLGCDGTHYENDCQRLRAGARFAALADAPESCEPPGVWAREPLSGLCQYFADTCHVPQGWDYFYSNQACRGPSCSTEVWARDSVTGECRAFESDCEVPLGVEFFTDFEDCQLALNQCSAERECAEGFICDVQSCNVDAAGLCVPLPADCVDTVESAGSARCGCDGVTYESDCQRILAGVALAHAGLCGTE